MVWFLLFPQVSPYLGGYAGLISLLVWFGLAVFAAQARLCCDVLTLRGSVSAQVIEG
jgi:hypothetical protein